MKGSRSCTSKQRRQARKLNSHTCEKGSCKLFMMKALRLALQCSTCVPAVLSRKSVLDSDVHGLAGVHCVLSYCEDTDKQPCAACGWVCLTLAPHRTSWLPCKSSQKKSCKIAWRNRSMEPWKCFASLESTYVILSLTFKRFYSTIFFFCMAVCWNKCGDAGEDV